MTDIEKELREIIAWYLNNFRPLIPIKHQCPEAEIFFYYKRFL